MIVGRQLHLVGDTGKSGGQIDKLVLTHARLRIDRCGLLRGGERLLDLLGRVGPQYLAVCRLEVTGDHGRGPPLVRLECAAWETAMARLMSG